MNRNLCKTVLENGGKIIPLLISSKDSKGLGLMNPSILIDKTKILLCLRNINYTLYHCEGQQLFNNRWGPLSYLHPEHDMHLRTYNYMCELNPDTLEIERYWLTDTADLDKEPLWDFVGLEDARLVRWEDKLYQIGVRRDTTPNGQGRMELTELQEKDPTQLKEGESKYKEISRSRIEAPNDKNSYCEKNWMPVLDMPYHMVKWSNPTEVVKLFPESNSSQTAFLGKSHIPNVPDFRGGSQVVPWKNYRVALVHEVNLFNNKLSQKDATYTHRFIVWDKDWNIIKLSDSFSFMDGEIEFSCGLAFLKGDLLLTFGFQDNAAFVLRVPEKMVDELFGFKKNTFEWGTLENYKKSKEFYEKNIFEDNIYEKKFKVEENDVVLDLGADIGTFTCAIMSKKPKKVISVEPDKKYFEDLHKNTKNYPNVFAINRACNLTTLFDLYDLKNIDFLKIDSDKPYLVLEKREWAKKVKKISIMLNYDDINAKGYIKEILSEFKNVVITKLTGEDITETFRNEQSNTLEEKTNSYQTLMIYIDNRPPKVEEKKIKLGFKRFESPIKKENK